MVTRKVLNELSRIPLKSKLGSAPVTTLGIVLDSVICPEAAPLWQRTVLPLLLSEGALRAESFLRRLCFDDRYHSGEIKSKSRTPSRYRERRDAPTTQH